MDAQGNIADSKELIKLCLIQQWETSKQIYMRMSDEHKSRVEQITGLDEGDFEDDNIPAATTFVDSLVDDAAAENSLAELKELL